MLDCAHFLHWKEEEEGSEHSDGSEIFGENPLVHLRVFHLFCKVCVLCGQVCLQVFGSLVTDVWVWWFVFSRFHSCRSAVWIWWNAVAEQERSVSKRGDFLTCVFYHVWCAFSNVNDMVGFMLMYLNIFFNISLIRKNSYKSQNVASSLLISISLQK